MHKGIRIGVGSLIVVLVIAFTLGNLVTGGDSLALAADPDQQKPEHAIDPVISWAEETLKGMDKIKDYTARLVKRERVDGVLGEYQYIDLKVRHKPFSVYMHFLGPDSVKGREVIYVEGQNDGKLQAHETGLLFEQIGTVSLKPDGFLAMRGQRYPITEIGMKNLSVQLIKRGKEDRGIPAPCEVKVFKNAKIEGRSVTCVQLTHPVRHNKHFFYKAQTFVDNELNVPIRYVSWNWPKKPGDKPLLDEEYSYLNLKVNQDLTDEDFSIKNPAYKFP